MLATALKTAAGRHFHKAKPAKLTGAVR
jgi:hypothetical protein